MRICLISVLVMAAWTAPALAEEAMLRSSGKWTKASARTTRDLRGFRPQPVTLSKYGGLASGPKRKATGFFRTEQVRGRWWLVDPDDHLFLTVGLCSVNLSMFKDSEVKEAFDGREAWWHGFKYGTQVDKKFQCFTDMTGLMKRVNDNVYRLASYFMR